MFHSCVKMTPFCEGLHTQREFKAGDRSPFASEVEPMRALFPNSRGVPTKQSANSVFVATIKGLVRWKLRKPLDGKVGVRPLRNSQPSPEREVAAGRVY